MTVVLVFLFLLFLILSYLFFAPFYLEINSTSELLRFRFHRIAVIKLALAKDTMMLEIKIMGWTKKMDLLQPHTKPRADAARKTTKLKSGNRAFNTRKFCALLFSFKIVKCKISIDTGDEMLNGILYPVFFLLGYRFKKDIKINFVDENIIRFEVKNTLARMTWAYINA